MNHDNEVTEEQLEAARLANEQEAKTRRAQELADIREVLDTDAGRRVLHRRLIAAGLFDPVFSSDPLAMARDEGRRMEGLDLLKELEAAAPGALARMLQESKQ